MTPLLRIPVVLALATLAVACPGSRVTAPIPNLPFATVTPSCGPADGPAVEITLGSAADPSAMPHVRLMIYQGVSQLTRRWTLGADVGFATYVAAPNQAEAATSGIVDIERVDTGNNVTGTVQLVFPHAGTIRGRFQAIWVPLVMMCG